MHDFGDSDEAKTELQQELDALDAKIRRQLDDAVAFAKAGAELPKAHLLKDVYAE